LSPTASAVRSRASGAAGADTPPADNDDPPLTLRQPDVVAGDGYEMWRLSAASEALETNSEYAYHLFAQFFASTSIVAELGERPVGFIAGFRPPDQPETLFVWQIGVDADFRGRGIARRMLDELMARTSAEGVRYLEASVTPSNAASLRTFHSYQERQRTRCEESMLFRSSLFGSGEHESELRLRIGPTRRVEER